MPNPCPDWLPEFVWDNLTVLDHLPSFRNIASSFEQNTRDWKDWYLKPEPENVPLPGEWENKCNELQRMIIVRCFRPDRVIYSLTAFISNNLDSKYVDPPPFDIGATFDVSSPATPLIFVLSPGVDPRYHIKQLAEEKNMTSRLKTLALGQGQSGSATRMIEEGIRDGSWVFFANCHLMISWLDKLELLVEEISIKNPNPNFRLWLSSSPHPKFPTSILQRGIKITTEPPKGIKQNLQRLYNLIPEGSFNRSKTPHKYKKLLFSLCFFHSILLERKKFMTLGWNRTYDFNDADFQVSDSLLSIYLDEYEHTPWDAIKYLIADLNYGGHVTDKWDRRLLGVYAKKLFCPEVLTIPNFRLSSLFTYFVPEDGPLQTYKVIAHKMLLINRITYHRYH
jgi:dynein heavy chain